MRITRATMTLAGSLQGFRRQPQAARRGSFYPERRNTIATGVIEEVTWPVGFNSPVSPSITNWTIVSPFWLAPYSYRPLGSMARVRGKLTPCVAWPITESRLVSRSMR